MSRSMGKLARRANVAVALLLLLGSGALVLWPQGAVAEETGSKVVVRGPASGVFGEDFSALEIEISQTRDLVNQAVNISWQGGKPSRPDPAAQDVIGTNFLQIMQCWGDPLAADDPLGLKFRETCQWGGGENINRRAPMNADSREVLPAGAQMVPFRSGSTGEISADGSPGNPFPDRPCGAGMCPGTFDSTLSPYFSQYTTNEIYQAPTTQAGRGQAIFEVHTSVQSPHLGCGNAGRLQCSLVILPRGETGPNGPAVRWDFGPLSASAWQDRIVVPLEFLPRAGSCPLGVAERRTLGTELAAAAMASWQPAMCAGQSKVFGYAAVGDTETARSVRSQDAGAAGLGFTLDPVTPAAGGPSIFHAPVALNSVVIAFNIDVRLPPNAIVPDWVQQQAGGQVTELKLTPLIVARLLTQYYQRDVPGGSRAQEVPYLQGHPRTVSDDPDFRADNEIFSYFQGSPSVDGLMVTADNSVTAREIWRWVLADPAARAFLTGPDVNPNYRVHFDANNVPVYFPKDDPSTFRPDPAALADINTVNLRPPVDSLSDGARQALRADARAQVVWDSLAIPPRYRPQPPTEYGKRFALVITDAASAARYGLPVAKLRNRAGEFVSPVAGTVLTGLAAMEPHPVVPQVRTINPAKIVPGAYPLPMLAYAAVDGSEAADARADYAALIRYAIGAGQTSGVRRGELPAGYVPLPTTFRLEAQAAVTQLEQYTYVSPTPSAPADDDPPPPNPPPASPPPAPVPTTGSVSPPVYVAESTKASPVGNVRYALAGCLAAGALALLIGPFLRGRRTVHVP